MERNLKVRAPRIDKTAISPYENYYCDGYGALSSRKWICFCIKSICRNCRKD